MLGLCAIVSQSVLINGLIGPALQPLGKHERFPWNILRQSG